MFVRVKSTPNSPRQSVQIVASVRDGQTVKQRIVRHIGIAMDDDELVRLKHLAEVVKAKLQAQTQPELFTPEATAQQVIAARPRTGPQALKVDLKQLRETQRVVTGIHAVYGPCMKSWGCIACCPAIAIVPHTGPYSTASWRAWPIRAANATACVAWKKTSAYSCPWSRSTG